MVAVKAYYRFFVVARQFLPLVLSYLRDRYRFFFFGRSRNVTAEMRVERAEALLDSLLTLGPTFIKLGQLLSTRPDALPPEYIDVLTQLQDDVPPAPWEEARTVVEDELGSVEESFEEFDTEAISGASLGQVYRARADGQDVAVKVRRPGIEDLVETDLTVIRWTLPLVIYFVDDARAFSLGNLADEFSKTIREEMDYEREASMLEEIRGNFTDDPKIAIPAVVDSHSGPRVLTMEYIGGTKITDVDELDERGVDREQVAERVTRTYLKMITQDGVYQADPHPGNLAVKGDGTVVFYDFGMSGRVDEFLQEKIIDFYIAVASRDIDEILDILIEMGTLSPDADRATMSAVLDVAIQDARGEDIETWRVQQIIGQVEDTIYEFPLRLPSNLALVMRVATVVEGVCLTLDSDFDFIAVASHFLTERGYREESIQAYLEGAGEDVREAARAAVDIPPKLDRSLDRLERDNVYVRAGIEDDDGVLDRLARRVVYGALTAAGIVSTTVLYVAAEMLAAGVAGVATMALVVLLWRSFRERRGIRTAPKVTERYLDQRRRHRE
ncbi:ABC1 kinase family protein [Halanaeroarchaeum sulfurireducens]|uniref:Membrane protein n=1 Tax=Halanaeroarchaeum sulfurireducens TaxID=1604004 RepID=A0A0F7PDP2_9EURY|nr:AarF/ABC1/UbiB kinase family protein [Halanaeroarchaeum sulfurireducens]AKH98315.1 membrane protein [Halanaeroarchaeum sulfurireducens]ALG82709.1 membrane protein [Halanaeroarchaeum sulfurireducens]